MNHRETLELDIKHSRLIVADKDRTIRSLREARDNLMRELLRKEETMQEMHRRIIDMELELNERR